MSGIELQTPFDEPEIVLANRVEQFVGEAWPRQKVHQEVLHASQRPRPLEQAEADAEPHGEARRGAYQLAIFASLGRRAGKEYPFSVGPRNGYSHGVPISLSIGAVPQDSKSVAKFPRRLFEEVAGRGLEIADVILDERLKIPRPEMPRERFRGLHGEAHVPGDVRRVLEPNRRKDNFARGHGGCCLS